VKNEARDTFIHLGDDSRDMACGYFVKDIEVMK